MDEAQWAEASTPFTSTLLQLQYLWGICDVSAPTSPHLACWWEDSLSSESLCLGRDNRIAHNPETHTQYVQSQISRPDSGVPLILSSSCPTHNTFGHVDLEEKTVLSGFCCVFSSALPVSVTKTPVSTSQWELESSVKVNSLIPSN